MLFLARDTIAELAIVESFLTLESRELPRLDRVPRTRAEHRTEDAGGWAGRFTSWLAQASTARSSAGCRTYMNQVVAEAPRLYAYTPGGLSRVLPPRA
ncbi:hypothetical protein DHEL01_v211833 [Diaporthe helianthi]|uniref:Uncharacterized protein n=1 Tax=Diaporthe helianthi TaxID=158607 RepID=A0A2P5HHP4_DIAHE|nr:hypothetical protein DHEL01_v211833 [Diaporthe helianthi]